VTPAYVSPLADHLWQSSLFAGIAGLLTLALGNNRARVRHWVWLVASWKFLIPFSVLISLGGQIHWRTVPQAAQASLSAVMAEVSQPFTVTVAPPVWTPARRPAANPIPAVLWTVWACGFLGISCSWWIRWRRIRASVRGGSPVPLAVPITAVSSPTLLEPGVFGVFRPVILLPEGILNRLTAAQLKGIIAHELCHVYNRDNLTAAIHMFVETVFWFHPLVWWIGKRMLDERERACDEVVLQLGSEPRIYAEGILTICKLYVESPLACAAGVTGSNLRRRIEEIISNRAVLKLDLRKRVALVSLGILTVAAPIAVGLLNAPATHAQSPIVLTTWKEVGDASGAPANADVQVARTLMAPAQEIHKQDGGRVRPAGKPLTFDVASIKPSNPQPGGKQSSVGGSVRFTDAGVTGRLVTVKHLIEAAYNLSSDQLSGGPGWLDSATFNLDAKTESPSSTDQLKRMLQNLLADRCKLTAHRGTKEFPVYFLTVGKGGLGPALHLLKDGTSPPEINRNEFLSHQAFGPTAIIRGALEDFALKLSSPPFDFGRRVIDKTNLHGTYIGYLHWAKDDDDPISAVRDEFNMKLEPHKAPVDVLVIDHAERPSGN